MALKIYKAKYAKKESRLTGLELPYKMFLSPIAEPIHSSTDFKRLKGSFCFIDNQYIFEKNGSFIRKPWESELLFRDLEGNTTTPRFKVVSYTDPQKGEDEFVEFLPAPVHREELHHLTMTPQFDRDVLSNYFKLSALGGTAYLKYRNDEPLKYSTVAWEQDVKLARDNYVSITFRAVDVFTGLKLLVSIVSERRYKYGVSFLEKRYFVTYAENEKVYDQNLVISTLPFKKITPKNSGVYFKSFQEPPVQSGTEENKDVFIVAKPYTQSFNEDAVIPFEYDGIDKAGKKHTFKLKMAFIPAETYELIAGEYYWNPKDLTAYLTAGEPISFERIGYLNPKYEESKCPDSECKYPYTYRLTKSFDKRRLSLKTSLEVFKKYALKNDSCYQAILEGNLTYAKIDKLKENKVIDINSSAATFKTKSIFLFSELGDKIDASDLNDSYRQDFPLRPLMLEANILVSQIDQIEGSHTYRKVNYYNRYLESRFELDEYHANNQKKLLFTLTKRNSKNDGYQKDPINGFFTNNYKSAGALVNPGITISHVSILDQGITYNDLHNEGLAKKPIPSVNVIDQTFPSLSLFGSQDAEIMGIPLLDIIGEVMPVMDIPVFNYLEKAQDSIKKLGAGYEVLKDRIESYEEDLERAKDDLQSKEYLFKQQSSTLGKQWLESVLEQFDTLESYTYQLELFQDSSSSIKDYVSSTLEPINKKLYTKYKGIIGNRNAFEQKIKKIIKITNVATQEGRRDFDVNVRNLIGPVVAHIEKFPTNHFKELVKIYCISQVVLKNKKLDFSDKIFAISQYPEANKQLNEYRKSLQEAFQEANSWSTEFLKNEKNKLEKQTKEVIEALKDDLKNGSKTTLNPILQQLTLLPFFRDNEILDLDNVENTLASAIKLTRTYQNYNKVYQTLKEEPYTELCKELGILENAPNLKQIEQELIANLKNCLQNQQITVSIESQAFQELEEAYTGLWIELDKKVVAGERWIKEYSDRVKVFKSQLNLVYGNYTKQVKKIDQEYQKAKNALDKAKASVQEWEEKVNYYAQDQLSLLSEEIKVKRKEILSLKEIDPKYYEKLDVLQKHLNKLNAVKRKINEISHQKFNYKHSTKNFRKASLGGVIEFIPADTELTIDVNYEVELNIDEFDRPPSISKQDYYTRSTLTDFKLGLLNLIAIDFERVSFVTGSTVKDDFTVNIRDVQFAGPLSFVQAFQEYLNSLSDNLVFEVTTSFAKVGYSFAIPDFTAGYFNFFNFNLSAQMLLPFDPKKSLQIAFGFGSEESKFGITVAGLFGGQGYFNIIAEPKRGIVGMVLVLEFGAIFYLDLYVAKGTVYLVGGIFIKRYLGEIELRGYILCVGRFNVLGLFSASVSFYLGLHGDGNILDGQCVMTLSMRFSKFFKVSVRCRMKKRIKGGKKQSSAPRISSNTNTINLLEVEAQQLRVEASKTYFGSYI
ncbi:MAG: hypothetical protein RPR97_03085 [Colwellia sp.]